MYIHRPGIHHPPWFFPTSSLCRQLDDLCRIPTELFRYRTQQTLPTTVADRNPRAQPGCSCKKCVFCFLLFCFVCLLACLFVCLLVFVHFSISKVFSRFFACFWMCLKGSAGGFGRAFMIFYECQCLFLVVFWCWACSGPVDVSSLLFFVDLSCTCRTLLKPLNKIKPKKQIKQTKPATNQQVIANPWICAKHSTALSKSSSAKCSPGRARRTFCRHCRRSRSPPFSSRVRRHWVRTCDLEKARDFCQTKAETWNISTQKNQPS